MGNHYPVRAGNTGVVSRKQEGRKQEGRKQEGRKQEGRKQEE
jgi:hypothetical protein